MKNKQRFKYNIRLLTNKIKIEKLEKRNKRFTIQEKKLFVKEKTFENERADYHDKLLFLKDRVVK